MIEKFSMLNILSDKEKKKNQYVPKNDTRISDQLLKSLTDLGFSIDQVVTAFSKYNFSSIEEGIKILAKDEETHLYNHEYTPYIDNLIKNKCRICSGAPEEHFNISNNFSNQIQILDKIQRENFRKNMIGNNKNITSKVFEVSKINMQNIDTYDEDLCPICLTNNLSEEHFALSCKHLICVECVRNYFRINIEEGKLGLKCLYGGCTLNYPAEIIKSFSSQKTWDQYKRYNKNQKNRILLNSPNFIHCPYPDCDQILELENYDGRSTLPEQFISCDSNHEFCLKCRENRRNHRSGCSTTSNSLYEEIIGLNAKNKDIFKKCPECNIIIEKMDGCNIVKCSNCNYQFCWLCLREYESDHYAIYNVSGCPGMKYGKNCFLIFSK